MKIKCKNKNIKWIFNRVICDERIEFVNGVATVTEEQGEQLLKLYPDLAPVTKAKAKKDEED